jgi:hypothetical protein
LGSPLLPVVPHPAGHFLAFGFGHRLPAPALPAPGGLDRTLLQEALQVLNQFVNPSPFREKFFDGPSQVHSVFCRPPTRCRTVNNIRTPIAESG